MPEITEEEIHEAFRYADQWRIQEAKKAMFKAQCEHWEVREDTSWLTRRFCWLKALVCLLMGRINGSYLDNNTLCIRYWNESSCGEYGSSWDALWVSTKLFSGWQVCVCTDGT